MAGRLSYSLCRAIKTLSTHHRVKVNPALNYQIFNKFELSHGFCSTAISKEPEPPLEPNKLPEIATEEIDRELVPTEDFPVYFPPTFNLAAYVDKSETLKKFVELGVNLSKIEKRKDLGTFLLKLDFEKDVKGHILFLHDLGVPPEIYGTILTKNIMFLKNSLDDLETRVYYLRSKNFDPDQVKTIVMKDPFWLNFSTKRIDRRLGWFQKNFELTGDDVRFLATRYPRVVTSNLMHIREISFCVKEEMGFNKEELKILLLALPKLFMRSKLIEFHMLPQKPRESSHTHSFKFPQQIRILSWNASITSTMS